jgi:pantoate--beta-alanine ligase
VVETINHNPYLKVEYFEIASEPDLEEVTDWTSGKKIIACIAVFAGNVRLIDNVYFN